MNIFKNSVGRPSNETKRKRKVFLIGVILLVVILSFGLIYLGWTLTSRIIANKNSAGLGRTFVPVYLNNVTPIRTIVNDLSSNDNNESTKGYTSGQGMTRMKVNNKYYIITGVILNSNFDKEERASEPTFIYIIEETSGKVVASIRDYSFGHINSIANDNFSLYIYCNETAYKLSKAYVSNAIKRGGVISKDYTEHYIQKTSNIPQSLASLVYDSHRDYLYGSNKSNLYSLTLDDLKADKILSHYHIREHQQNSSYAITNAGAAILGDYLLLGRYYKDGIGNSVNVKNTIDIYKLTFDEMGMIETSSYVATYAFNRGDMLKGEIQDLEVVNDNTLLIHYNGINKNKLYYLDLSQLNYTKVKVVVDNQRVKSNSLVATVYDSNGDKIGNYKPNAYGNLVIRNLTPGTYKLKIVSANGDIAVVRNKEITFTIGSYTPYQYLKIRV